MKKVFAFFLLLLGVGMVISGVYYKDILLYLNINTNEEKRLAPEFITCIRKEKNMEAELSVSETSKMFFNKMGRLMEIEDSVVISPVDNSSESMQKLNRYYSSMDKILIGFGEFTGFSEKHSQESNLVKYTMSFDLKNFSNNKSTDKKEVSEETKEAIITDEDGNVTVDFSSIDKDGKLKFPYRDKYKNVKSEREKEGFTCTT